MTIVDEYRAKFWATKDKLDAIDKGAEPLDAERNKLLEQFEPKLRELEAQIKAKRAGRYEVAQELAFLTKALGDKVGERP